MPLESNAAATAATTPPAPAGAAVPAQQPAAPAQTVTIPLDQLNAFTSMQARLAKIEEDRARDAADAQRQQAEALAKKGDLENALVELRKQNEAAVAAERAKLLQTEERAKRYALDGELARTLASQPLVPGGADQLTQLWRNQFNVEPQGDTFAVRTATMQSVTDFVTTQLGRAEYAHFLRATNPAGGTGGSSPASQAAHTPAANQAPPPEPRNMGEAIAMNMAGIAKRSAQNAVATGGSHLTDDGRIVREAAAGFGLRPLRTG
jgi:hypothetical protein